MRALSKSARVKAVAELTGRSCRTIWKWASEGCNLNDPASINTFSEGNRLRQHANLIRKTTTKSVQNSAKSVDEAIPDLNSIELAPIGERGAAAALARLEQTEERAFARLERAIDAGNPFQVKAAQEFYLRASESLRRLDAAIETERRAAGEQIPLREIEAIAVQISTWLRTSFEEFLGSESPSLMQNTDLGAFKYAAIKSFCAILRTTVKSALKTEPGMMPEWAIDQVREGWNVQNP